MDKAEIKQEIVDKKIIAIIRGIDEAKIIPTVQALYDGGIRLMEVTVDHDRPNGLQHTVDKIRTIKQKFNDEIVVGAGTVVTEDEVSAVAQAGARLIISPNVDERVIQKSKRLDLVSIPGALTPTEIVHAYHLGADFVKLFPAGEIGFHYIKSLMAPLSYIPMLAVGGVNVDNIEKMLDIGVVGVGIGGNLVIKEAVKEEQYEEITAVAKQFINKL